jgi:Phage major capsid protein E
MANLVYDTATLVAVVQSLFIPQKWLLERYFPNIVTSDSEYVAIDVEIGLRRMAPFVSPLVEGKMVEQQRTQTNLFKPAYLKPKSPLDLRKPVKRRIGEKIGGSLTPAERAQANVAETLVDHIGQIDRRCEWMAARALSTGTVTISGDGYQTVVVDFGRDASLTIAKVAGTRWTEENIKAGTASPSRDIEAWGTQLLKKSGAVASDLVFTPASWAGFIADPKIEAAIIYPKFSDSGNTINAGPQIQLGGQFKGKWGQYELYLYNDWYIDDDGIEQPMLVDGTVLMSGPYIEGVRSFGQILDPKFNYAPMPYAPKTWTTEDPAQTLVMTQSSPIMVPSRPNASLSAKVV